MTRGSTHGITIHGAIARIGIMHHGIVHIGDGAGVHHIMLIITIIIITIGGVRLRRDIIRPEVVACMPTRDDIAVMPQEQHVAVAGA